MIVAQLRAYALSNPADTVTHLAIKAYLSRNTTFGLEQHLRLFAEYAAATRLPGVSELHKRTGISEPVVRNMLLAADVPFAQRRENFDGETRQAMQALHDGGFSHADIAYVLRLGRTMPGQRIMSRARTAPLCRIGPYGQGGAVTRRDAMAIYEAQDLGFSADEIAALLEAPSAVVTLALARRDEYAPQLAAVLHTVFGTRDQPYVAGLPSPTR
jgi:hypothetical protein